jgi:astacin
MFVACAQSRLRCLRGGYPDPRNCNRCKCPSGFGGTVCQDREQSTNATCGATVPAGTDFQSLSGRVGSGLYIAQTEHENCYWHITVPYIFCD